jgi:hypothetical protein
MAALRARHQSAQGRHDVARLVQRNPSSRASTTSGTGPTPVKIRWSDSHELGCARRLAAPRKSIYVRGSSWGPNRTRGHTE